MKKIALLSLLSLAMAACGEKKSAERTDLKVDTRNMYFGGDFIYFADAAVFSDCATGARYNVSRNDVYLQVEKKYSSFKFTNHETISLDVLGYLVPKSAAEEGHPYTLVMTEVLEIDPGLECDEASIKTGHYVMGNDTLSVAADYTWSKGGKQGVWGMLDAEEMFLIAADTSRAHIDLWSNDLIFDEQTRYVKQN